MGSACVGEGNIFPWTAILPNEYRLHLLWCHGNTLLQETTWTLIAYPEFHYVVYSSHVAKDIRGQSVEVINALTQSITWSSTKPYLWWLLLYEVKQKIWKSYASPILANCPGISGTVLEADLASRCPRNIQNCPRNYSRGKCIVLY